MLATMVAFLAVSAFPLPGARDLAVEAYRLSLIRAKANVSDRAKQTVAQIPGRARQLLTEAGNAVFDVSGLKRLEREGPRAQDPKPFTSSLSSQAKRYQRMRAAKIDVNPRRVPNLCRESGFRAGPAGSAALCFFCL